MKIITGKGFMHSTHYNRNNSDLYETPYSMTEQLLDKESFSKNHIILEPACGKGAITKVLKKYSYTVISYDLNFGNNRQNFFKETKKYRYTITNPPYLKADLFVEKAKEICTDKFAFLLRTNFLSGQKRFHDKRYEHLKKIYVFTRMSDLRCPIREDGKYATAGIVYAWFIWEMGYKKDPIVKWIDNSMFVIRSLK